MHMVVKALATTFIALSLTSASAEEGGFGPIQSPDYTPRPNVCGHGYRQNFDTGKCQKITYDHCHSCGTAYLKLRH